jgi:hypothetical protein
LRDCQTTTIPRNLRRATKQLYEQNRIISSAQKQDVNVGDCISSFYFQFFSSTRYIHVATNNSGARLLTKAVTSDGINMSLPTDFLIPYQLDGLYDVYILHSYMTNPGSNESDFQNTFLIFKYDLINTRHKYEVFYLSSAHLVKHYNLLQVVIQNNGTEVTIEAYHRPSIHRQSINYTVGGIQPFLYYVEEDNSTWKSEAYHASFVIQEDSCENEDLPEGTEFQLTGGSLNNGEEQDAAEHLLLEPSVSTEQTS